MQNRHNPPDRPPNPPKPQLLKPKTQMDDDGW